MRALLRIAAITTATGLLLAPVAGVASASASHPAVTHAATVGLRGGTTTLTTVPGLAHTLLGHGIAPFATAPGTESLLGSTSNPQLKFSFPVTGGRVNPSRLRTINLTHKRLSGVVSSLGVRVIVASLNFSHARIRVRLHRVRASRIGARLTTAAAVALDSALGTSLFVGGMKIATVATLVRF